MKKTTVCYWVFTVLFVALMLFTAIPDIFITDDVRKVMAELGYPPYFTPFIGVAKVLGCIAILIPGLKRVKEWAYAGLFFDLVGAEYSQIMTYGFIPQMVIFMVVAFTLGILSYIFYRKLSAW